MSLIDLSIPHMCSISQTYYMASVFALYGSGYALDGPLKAEPAFVSLVKPIILSFWQVQSIRCAI